MTTTTAPKSSPTYTVHFYGTMSHFGSDHDAAQKNLARLFCDNEGAGIYGEIREHLDGKTTVIA